ncbi:MAG: ABC transporter permease [Acidobacteriota bacterium]
MKVPFKYNLRNLRVRWMTSALTAGGTALTVAVFVGIMALSKGLELTMQTSGDAQNLIVMRQGATVELNSQVTQEQYQTLRDLEGVAKDGREPLVSPEMVVAINRPRRGSTKGANITLRGVKPIALKLRADIQIVEGRMFQPGLREIILSRRIQDRFQDTGLGDRMRFGSSDWEVVGIFDAAGTAQDSEIWADLTLLGQAYGRGAMLTSVLLRTTDVATQEALAKRIEDDPRLRIKAQQETKYYQEANTGSGLIRVLGNFVAVIMGIGACFAGMNTMYAAVINRRQEIATLRVLGFRRRNILFSFAAESLSLALVGGVVGCVLALPINGLSTGTLNFATFSEIAFAFRVTPDLVLKGMLFAVFLGLFGGLLPSWNASRQQIVQALRDTV